MSTVIEDREAIANIAQNVTSLLKEKSWSQGDLHRATGESRMTISRICNGQHMPFVATLARIAEALETSVDWLLANHSKGNRRTA